MTGLPIQGTVFAAALLLSLLAFPVLIRRLQAWKAGRVIQEELPESHQLKAGTPTGGGIYFVLAGLIAGLLALAARQPGAWAPTAGLICGGLVGFTDDLVKLREGWVGIPARLKFPIQVLAAVPVAWLATPTAGEFLLPLHESWLYLPLTVVAIVGTANAVNITDGMDGLAGTLVLIAVAGLVLLLPHSSGGERLVAAGLCGALVAFLVFNRHPARVFMGDTGSLALGYALAAMAIQQGFVLLLPVVGLAFVIETLSVIIQVAYFKATRGRRIFKMTPIHYTFRLEGWSENRIVLAFAAVGLATVLASAWLARTW